MKHFGTQKCTILVHFWVSKCFIFGPPKTLKKRFSTSKKIKKYTFFDVQTCTILVLKRGPFWAPKWCSFGTILVPFLKWKVSGPGFVNGIILLYMLMLHETEGWSFFLLKNNLPKNVQFVVVKMVSFWWSQWGSFGDQNASFWPPKECSKWCHFELCKNDTFWRLFGDQKGLF